MIKITFPDGSVREYNEGVTGLQIAESISSRLAQDVLACGVNGEIYDLGRPIMQDAEVVLYKWEDEQGKHAFWHTSAHLLAEALQELYPGILFGIGPAIENGFYYDVDPGETTIKEADLPAIEKKMAELVAKKEAVVRQDIAKADALKMFGDRGETYKCELISELEDGHITTYTQGAFTDLCRGPHLMTTAPIKAIKLTSVAGAYWRGQEDRKMMTRIYGITFPKKKMLDEYLVLLEEAKKAGNEDICYMFASTSKITHPGSGIAVIAASQNNLAYLKKALGFSTIGYDKMNQLRHLRFFGGKFENLVEHMKKHKALIAPKFQIVESTLEQELADLDIANWSNPQGGYFISFNQKGCAKRIVSLCKEAGVVLTGAGASFPHGVDPEDENIRISPTFPTEEELQKAMDVFVCAAKLAAAEQALAK